MGFGKSFKKVWKKAYNFAKDSHSMEAISGAISGAVSGAAVGGGLPGAIVGAVAGGLAGTAQHQKTERQEKAQKRALQQQRDIANMQAAAAAIPVATAAGAQEMANAEASDLNYATERRRALSAADTTMSRRLQRWARTGKRRTL